jgi:quinolinate synthase
MRLTDEIRAEKERWGKRLMILGHHYQRANIVDVADHIGDSFGLAKIASQAKDCEYIVFCGVRFMAESAAILCRPDQKVFHPEPEAGCPMADMAPMDSVETAWNTLTSRKDYAGRKMIPVTYMNSHAPLKGFTGEHGGAVCTSSNAAKVLEWALSQGDLVLFFPDQHLGRNTALQMGIKPEEMRVWYPSKADGGIDTLDGVKILLWNGHCPVHMKFSARDVHFVKANFPGALVAVHPECTKEVVELADAVGSTEYLSKYVKTLPPRTLVFMATEVNMVDRLKKENPQLRIEFLTRSLCPTMYMVNEEKLLDTLKNLPTNEEKAVPISDSLRTNAKLALERMLALA